MEKSNINPTSIRLRKDLFEKIKKDAEKDKRSITKQIEYMLEKYCEKDSIKKTTLLWVAFRTSRYREIYRESSRSFPESYL